MSEKPSRTCPFDVSLVIVNWNTRTELESCLRSFATTSKSVAVEIIVVDNASVDGSPAMVRSEFPDVHLIANSDNKGFAGGVNQGIRAALGKYIFVLNSDIVSQEGTLLKLIAAMDASPEVGAIAPRLINSDGSLQKDFFRKLPTLLQVLLFYTALSNVAKSQPRLVRKYFEETTDELVPEYDVQQIPGGCIMVRREVIDRVGMMDEQFVLFFEDVDWCYRIREGGWKLRIINTVSMIHLGGRSFIGRDRTWMLGRFMLSLNQYVDKHGSLWFRISTKVLTFGNSFIIFLIRVIQKTILKGIQQKQSFQESYRSHSYLLKLFLEYYTGMTFSKISKRDSK